MTEQVEVPRQEAPEHETVPEFRARARAWLAAHVPLESPGEPFLQWDDEGVARDRAIQRSLWDGGIAGVHLPREYGGLGLSAAHQEAFREEAAEYRMPENFGNAFNVVIPTLLTHGSELLKRRHIPRILRGDDIWCQFLSEPSGGSDLAGLLTRAERTEGGFVLDGAKIWTTGGNYSDRAICLARTNPDVPKHAGLTMFVVDMRTPGIEIAPVRLLDGSADFCQEHIDDVFVPAENVVGEVDDGWRVATTLMVNERSAIGRGWSLGGQRGQQADTGIGLAPELLDLARELGRDTDPSVRALIGERWVLEAVMAATTKRVGAAIAAGDLPGPAAAILKAMSGATAVRRGEIDLAVAGVRAAAAPAGGGELWGLHRLSSHGIGGGTTEMQRNAIAERLLGLPREPSDDRVVPFRQLRQNTRPA
ncbi:acyl-CoA dehydrogenase family protein [Trujillonella endophytica]|uniref:Acyl-CoA dehydrogenase n=1 Tax=Trujillonella endophytica TaxID=673521 RepID=A0A1H8VY92_9ACTN|nr:acyl-CoA dehydrogenase family protein [Trujillella endophytica]SEP20243.1 Acyl-CoA dehydrogenase [Trujillella endophytica]